jgi:Caspase domain
LPSCKNDGQEIFDILSSLGYEIHDSLLGHVKWQKMRDSIYDFFNNKMISPDDTLLFYYSGHGIPDGDEDVYLAASEIDPDQPSKRGFNFDELTKLMRESISRRVVAILDCCYSGSAKLSKGHEDDAAKLGNDPTLTAVGGVYTAMWNVYLNEELKYTSTSPFIDINDQAFNNWDFDHVDPTGAHVGGQTTLYTAGDLAASMELNPYLKVFCANGYYDAVTPFFQTRLDLENMPLGNPESRHNLFYHTYPSGHMIYLDDQSRKEMKKELGAFYDKIHHRRIEGQIKRFQYRRRFSRTPY